MNQSINLLPIVHNNLLDIDDIESVNASDLDCLNEISCILKKYNKQSKFGLALLHKHFDLESDEILIESTDIKNRTLTTKPVKLENLLEGSYMETIWSFSENMELNQACKKYCPTDSNGKHFGYKEHG